MERRNSSIRNSTPTICGLTISRPTSVSWWRVFVWSVWTPVSPTDYSPWRSSIASKLCLSISSHTWTTTKYDDNNNNNNNNRISWMWWNTECQCITVLSGISLLWLGCGNKTVIRRRRSKWSRTTTKIISTWRKTTRRRVRRRRRFRTRLNSSKILKSKYSMNWIDLFIIYLI